MSLYEDLEKAYANMNQALKATTVTIDPSKLPNSILTETAPAEGGEASAEQQAAAAPQPSPQEQAAADTATQQEIEEQDEGNVTNVREEAREAAREEARRTKEQADKDKAEAQTALDSRYRKPVDLGPEIPNELRNDAAEQCKRLEAYELVRLQNTLIAGEMPEPELAAKVPALMRIIDIQEAEKQGPGFLKSLAKAPLDIAQGAYAGAVKGFYNVSDATLGALNFVDDLVGLNILENGQVLGAREKLQDISSYVSDNWIPKSWIGSVSASLGQNAVGMAAGGIALKGGASLLGAANTFVGGAGFTGAQLSAALSAQMGVKASAAAYALAKSAVASSTAFSTQDGTIFDSLHFSGLMTDPDDPEWMNRGRMVLGSVVSDVALSLIGKGVRKVIGGFRNAKAAPPGAAPNAAEVHLSGKAAKAVKQGLDDVDKGLRQAAEEGSETAAALVSHTQDIDAQSLTAKARSLFNQMDSEGNLAETTKHDVRELINTEPLTGAFMEDGGVEKLLHLGDIGPNGENLLGRAEINYITQHADELKREALDFVRAIGKSGAKVNELEAMATMSEHMAAGLVTVKGLMIKGAQTVKGLIAAINDPELTPALREAMIENELTNALKGWARLSQIYDSISTGAGRTLKAHQLNDVVGAVVDQSDNAVNRVVGRYQKVLETVGKMNAEQKMAFANRLVSQNNALKTANYMRQLGDHAGKKALNMATEVFMNSILSGPVTHFTNAMSNFIKAGIIAPLDDIVAGGIVSPLRGNGFDYELLERGWHAWGDIFTVFNDARQMAVTSFKLGNNILKADSSVIERQFRYLSSIYSGVDSNSVLGRWIDRLGAVVNLPSRFLMASDELSSQIAYRVSVRSQLRAEARRLFAEGAGEGMKLGDFINKHMKEHFDDFFNDTFDAAGKVVGRGGADAVSEIGKKALKHAQANTWTAPLAKGSIARSMQDITNNHPVARFIIPFVRTPYEIMEDALHHSVLAPITRSAREALFGGNQQAANEMIAKMSIGTAFAAGLSGLYLTGHLTGNGPKNKAQREALMAGGWRPNSVKIGDTYISYARMEPISTLMGIMADAGEIMSAANSGDTDETTASEALYTALFSIVTNFTNKTYMSGLSDFMDAITAQDGNKLERYMQNFALSFSPNFLNQTRRTVDPQLREARTLMDRLLERIPGLSSSLPAKHSWLTGEPVRYYGGRASGISPVVWEDNKKSQFYETLSKIGGKLSAPSNRINNITLEATEASFFHQAEGTVKINGKTQIQALQDAVNNYQKNLKGRSMDDTELAIECNKIISRYRKRAKDMTVQKFPRLKGVDKPTVPSSPSLLLKGRDGLMPPPRQQGTQMTQEALNSLANF